MFHQIFKMVPTLFEYICVNILKANSIILGTRKFRWMFPIKWRILSRTSSEESGKNEKKKKSYWASSTPWGHVLSLKTFCWNPALSWAVYFTETEKYYSGNGLKIIYFIQTWPSDVKILKTDAAHELETTSKFDLLKNWVPDCSAQDRNLTKSY